MDSSTSISEDAIADQPEETQPTPDEAPAPEPTVQEEAAASNVYTVTRIYDGDTIDAFKDGKTIKVRLACIDAPEADQPPHGQAATDRLSSLVPGQVLLNIVDEDHYGRSVAEVYTPEGAFLNLQMLESGNAVVYTEYLASCGDNANRLLAAEDRARSTGQGVWADAAFVMPWDYRQGVRPVAIAPETTPPPAPAPILDSEPLLLSEPEPTTANLPACVSSDCDCGDFSSWSQAQAVLAAFPGDPHRLDGDSDGEACESLR
ncbi:MAG: thermonuclease family protein [Cyanobacteria bacterium P01_D01_bin.115]